MGASTGLHPDFGSGLYDGQPIGIPFDVVSKTTPRSRVTFDYADESDKVAYPIPKTVHIEGGRASTATGTRCCSTSDACRLYELYALYPTPAAAGRPARARSGTCARTRVRPAGWTSADAAGLPIFPGLARYDEVARGTIDHALRFTVARTRSAYVYPARHYASSSDDPSLPPMGARVRLKASVDISGYPQQARIVLQALKTLRDDRRRQRLELVHQRRARPALVERRAARARRHQGIRLRGRRHLVAAAPLVAAGRSPSATFAAAKPHMPCTPPPGGVDALQR